MFQHLRHHRPASAGRTDADYDALFTKDKPIISAFHGYPTLVHELTYERTNRNLSVHGYQEEGTITTPFDMRVQNEIIWSRMRCCICPSWATAVRTSSSR